MPYEAIPTRFARAVGWRATATCWWGECPAEAGASHIVRRELRRGDGEAPEGAYDGWADWVPEPGTVCERCRQPVPDDLNIDDASHAGGIQRIYDTPSGLLEPGCLYWATWLPHRDLCFYGWTNCDGRHLMAVCPNGHHWDVDSKASNCPLPNDTTHRCWVRHGDPESGAVLVDKNGATCAAGGGSIQAADYHGFLTLSGFSAG